MAIFGFMTRKDENYFRKEAVSALQSYVNSNTRKLKSALFYDEIEKDLAGKRDKLARSCIAQINGNPQPNKDQVVAILKKAAEDNLKLTQEANEHLKRVYANDMEIPYNNARGEHVSSMEASKPKKQVGEGELQGILKTQLSHFQKIIQTVTQSAQRRANPTPTPVAQKKEVTLEYNMEAAIKALQEFVELSRAQIELNNKDVHRSPMAKTNENLNRLDRIEIAENCIEKLNGEPKPNNDQISDMLNSALKENDAIQGKAILARVPIIEEGPDVLQKILKEQISALGKVKTAANNAARKAAPDEPAPRPAAPRR